jgi:CysZ protein
MIGQALSALGDYGRALPWLFRPPLFRYVFWAGLTSLLLGGALLAWGLSLADDAGRALLSLYPFEAGQETVAKIASAASGLLIVLLILFLYRYVAMVIMSPFMSALSEALEASLTGRQPTPVGWRGALSDLLRGLRVSLRNLWRELLYTLLLLLVGLLLPVLGNLLSAVAVFLVQAYYAGFGNLDYTLERKRLGLSESVRYVAAHRGMALGNGTGFLLLLFVPLLGVLLAPALGAAAATISCLRESGQAQDGS